MTRIAFECRFGGLDGWGHLSRCSSLAQAAKKRGWETILLSESDLSLAPAEMRESFSEYIREDVARLTTLPAQFADVDFLVVDEMYWSDEEIARFVELFRSFSSLKRSIVVGIDDMQRRSMEAVDVVVNTELGLKSGVYPKACVRLLGERYCMLRDGFSNPADIDWRPNEDLTPVFIMIGGTDSFGFSSRVLHHLAKLRDFSFLPVLITGEESKTNQDIKKGLALFSEYEWHSNLESPEIAGLISMSRYAIIGCGTSTFELAAMNTPFLGLSVVDNQSSMADRINELWGLPILHLENGGRFFSRFSTAMEQLQEIYEKSGNLPYSRIDTRGCSRILDTIESY